MNFFSFKNAELIDYIPKVYRTNKEKEDDYSWFNEPPRYTVFRVNSLTTNTEEAVKLILECLKKHSSLHNCSLPSVTKHGLFPDCILVGSWGEGNKYVMSEVERAETIVDVSCACAVLRGAHVFAPGVLGLPFDTKEGSLVNVYADLDGKCTRGLSQKFPHRKLFIGEGVLHMNRHKLYDNNNRVHGIAIEILRTVSGIPNFSLPEELGMLQNFPSVLCSYILDVQNDQIILDMCAAPGNKTTHLANLMNNKGIIIALDKTEHKVKQITTQCKKFGITNVRAFTYNSTKAACAKSCSIESPPFKFNTFDRILLDAPCSALGKRPQLKNKITINELQSYPCLQKKLFRNAVCLLKPGGYLVYSTCTITEEENERIISWALKTFPELLLCKAEPYFGMPGLLDSGLTKEESECVQRFCPSLGGKSERDSIGFFIAKFKKKFQD